MFKSISWQYLGGGGIFNNINYLYTITDDDFIETCENIVPTHNFGASLIIGATTVIIRIYTQKQKNIAKAILTYFIQVNQKSKYDISHLIRINKERNPGYVYHEKEVDALMEKYSVLL